MLTALSKLTTPFKLHNFFHYYPFKNPNQCSIVHLVVIYPWTATIYNSSSVFPSFSWHSQPWRVFYGMSITLGLFGIFSLLDWGHSSLEREPQKFCCYFQQYTVSQGSWFQYTLLLVTLTLISWSRWSLLGISTVKLLWYLL